MLCSVSARRPGKGLGRAGTHPWPRECAPRSGELVSPVLLWFRSRLSPPPAPAELSCRRPRWFLRGSFRNASGRSAAARRPGVRPNAAQGERVRRGGPGAGDRRGGERREGKRREGAVSGWAPSRLHRRIAPALRSSSLPSPATARAAPALERPLLLQGSLGGTTISPAVAQLRPAPALLGGPPTQTLSGLFSVSIPRDGRKSLFPECPWPSPWPRASAPYPALGKEPHHSLAHARAMAGGWAPGAGKKGGALCRAGDAAG